MHCSYSCVLQAHVAAAAGGSSSSKQKETMHLEFR
jgi:hypothetical protein